MNEVTNAELWLVISTFIKLGLEMSGIIGLAVLIYFKFVQKKEITTYETKQNT
ncbi:hypothetical protein [Priestia megaterium]|uniref:hypothetical protein n=1 Tax=Priestia megaterium TaxID=1404 RepID=UPI003CC5A0C8